MKKLSIIVLLISYVVEASDPQNNLSFSSLSFAHALDDGNFGVKWQLSSWSWAAQETKQVWKRIKWLSQRRKVSYHSPLTAKVTTCNEWAQSICKGIHKFDSDEYYICCAKKLKECLKKDGIPPKS